jgi:hypothetical protein
MNTPVVMLVSVILWSFGISAIALLSLMGLDWLETRRTRLGAAGARSARIEQSRHQALPAKA